VAGCATRAIPIENATATPVEARGLRVALPLELREAVRRANRSAPLIPFASPLLDPIAAETTPPFCRSVDLAPALAADTDAIVDRWERDLRPADSPLRWLLAPLQGVERAMNGIDSHVGGLRRSADGLSLCSDRPVSDWPARLLHPSLWHSFPASTSAIDSIEFVASDSTDPGLLLSLGEADLSVVYGQAAARLVEAPPSGLVLTRRADWDVVYYLWADRRQRWVNDPPLRRWLAGVVDRAGLAEYLFAGQAEPAVRLLPAEDRAATWQLQAERPLTPGTRPRLELLFDEGDASARSIAERLRQGLERHAVTLQPRAVGREELEAGVRDGNAALVLLPHRVQSRDSVLGLMETVWKLGDAAEPARRLLQQAARHADAESRAGAARLAEDALLLHADLIPLVRLAAWLAAPQQLRGTQVGAYGVLRFERARWER